MPKPHDELPRADRGEEMLTTLPQLQQTAQRILRHSRPLVQVDFGPRLIQRLSGDSAVGSWANEHAARFQPPPDRYDRPTMDVSPFVPPQRQLSAARQGAPNWPGATPPSAPAASPASSNMDAIRRELESMGWSLK